MSNLLYALSGVLVVYFVSTYTSLFSPQLGALLLFSSYLMFDISKFLRFDREVYSLKSLFFLYLPKPFPTPILLLPNLLNSLLLIFGEVVVVIFIIVFYFNPIPFLNLTLFFIFLVLGAIIFGLLYDTLHFLSLSLFKQDNCPFCYMLNEFQDVFSKYPYDLLLSNKTLILIISLLLIPLYTYLPIKLFIMSSLSIHDLLYPVVLYLSSIFVVAFVLRFMYRYFLKVYETYGG